MFLVTDNGKEFINSQVQEYLGQVGIKFSPIAVSHPQANPVERINRTIKPMIRAYIHKDQSQWDRHIGEFQLAYNSAFHSSLKMSPYYLCHGQEPRQAGDICHLELEDLDFESQEWVKRVQRLDELRHKIESNMKKENERQEKYHGSNFKIPEVSIGDRVYYPNRKLSNKAAGYNASLGAKYLGPAIVSKLISPLVVELKNEKGKLLGQHYTPDLKLPRRSNRLAYKRL
ncbi:uncharacterized protein LOC141526501 [Cotesia typhae]|uniref:uncharacterized protein LOC141526501 n=1 Tax=Cotesia typhae TaxID=2053667 RepID=UPI003D698EE8